MSFQYDKLPNNDLFRIFELKPGQDDDSLHGNLRTFLRKEAPAYEALSYMWGSPDRVKHMECNNQKFMITSSLDSALRRLRLADESRYLWVDQICINQDSPTERSEQVSVMKDIYSGSKLVTAWLGQADPGEAADTQAIISALATIELQPFSYLPHFPDNKRLQELGLPTRESPAWAALNSMLQAPYFSRVWIIQELAVAPTYNLLWGDCLIPKVDFEALELNVTSLGMRSPDPDCLHMTLAKPSKGVCPIIESKSPMFFALGVWIGKDLLKLVSEAQNSHATNPVDKIFAVIGLGGEKTYGITPDYSKTKSEVFTEFALKVILETKNLKVLNYCDVEDPADEDRLPLWAPRWHHEATGDYFDMTHYAFKSSNDMEISFHISSNTKVLQLKGLHIDKVKETRTPLTRHTHETFTAMSGMIVDHESLLKGQYGQNIIGTITLTMLNGLVESTDFPGLSVPPEHSYLQSFTGLLIRSFVSSLYYDDDSYNSDRRATIQLIKMAIDSDPISTEFEPAWKEPQTLEFLKNELNKLYPDDMETALSYLEVMRRASYDVFKGLEEFYALVGHCRLRNFFITEKGYIGTGPRSLKPGDSVCILFGGDTPYIVRPRSSTSDEDLFLGNAYVHGIMDGEAITTWEGQKDSQNSKFNEKLFKLV
ncbi:related to HET-6OR heterokaryon incompatibility protein (het-6OR allele) [Fusarium fujikuroi]|nr:related to HET-6OR heterokaryon incompatibility protein (het-6OR allele) [Fusarium fujikuroi]